MPLGVILKNETKHEDMVNIMIHLQQYVPFSSTEKKVIDPNNNQEHSMSCDVFHPILFGGDQLTAERAVGSKRCRRNEDRGFDKLAGLTPVIEDWHAKVALLKVRFQKLFDSMVNYFLLGYLEDFV